MPDQPGKQIDIPGYDQPVVFPATMSDAAINAAATKLYQAKNPTKKQPPVASWTDTAVNWLPTAGGIVGGIAGGMAGGPATAIGGAAAGGMVGERLKEYANAARGVEPLPAAGEAVKRLGTQAALQGGAEVVGAGLGAGMAKAAPALMESAVKPIGQSAVRAAKSAAEIHPVVKTLLDEGINVSNRGMEKLNAILSATNQDIKDAIASVTGTVNPYKVTAKLRDTAQAFSSQVNPTADLAAVSRAGQEFLQTAPRPLSVQAAQDMKIGTYRQLSGKAYGELKGADIEAQKALARGLKDEIADEVNNSLVGFKGKLGLPGGVDITAQNAREGALLEARDALAKRLAVTNRQNPMGLASLAVTNPVTFLTVLMDRSPAVKSMLARGLYTTAGAASRVSPQLIKAAVTAIATSGEPADSSAQSPAGQP